jgi:hypothetical protein
MTWTTHDYDGDIHVVPVDDLKPHAISALCFCNPTPDEESDNVWIHHAMDQRELYEEGKPKS